MAPRAEPALLALADGRVFPGEGFGAVGVAPGEVVFNTSMTGYQEILTDPSYKAQVVTMTCPEVGNVGVNAEDVESAAVQVSALVVRNVSPIVSNWRASGSLGDYLAEANVVGISGIDTRALTRHLREGGAMNGVVASPAVPGEGERWVAAAQDVAPMTGRDLVREVTCAAPYAWTEGAWGAGPPPPPAHHVVAYDFGIKRNILRRLASAGCRVTVVPATFPAEEALALSPDGVFLSNGPGDPAAVPYAHSAVAGLLGRLPIFGICLGHQVLAIALGASSYKLRFGHRGANHPVRDEATGLVEITSQNHGFAVDATGLEASGVRITHVSLNDGTCEGLASEAQRAFSVQYHPEASPGPHDALPHFDRFLAAMGGGS